MGDWIEINCPSLTWSERRLLAASAPTPAWWTKSFPFGELCRFPVDRLKWSKSCWPLYKLRQRRPTTRQRSTWPPRARWKAAHLGLSLCASWPSGWRCTWCSRSPWLVLVLSSDARDQSISSSAAARSSKILGKTMLLWMSPRDWGHLETGGGGGVLTHNRLSPICSLLAHSTIANALINKDGDVRKVRNSCP